MRRDRLNRSRVVLFRRLDSYARVARERLARADDVLARFPSKVQRERHHLARVVSTLSAVSPLSVLSRGYAIAFSRVRNRRRPILDSSSVHAGDHIEVQLKKGSLACTVDAKTMGIESIWPVVPDLEKKDVL